MSNTPARMAADASGHIYSEANIKKEIPTGELHSQMYDRMGVESYGSYGSTIQASENSFSPSVIKELPKTYDEEAPEEEGAADEETKELGKEGREEEENEEEKEEKDQEDIHNVYEIEHEKSFNELYLAADRDDTEAVRRLLMSSVDVNVLDANKTTRSQLYATVKGLLNKKASVDTRSTPDIHGENDSLKPHWEQQLYLAAKNGHADVVDALLERGICNFELSFDYYETPLQVAVKERHTKVVEVIFKHSCKTYDKLTEDGQKLQETCKNLTETKDSMLVELEKSDGRCVIAELVFTEIYTPIEMMRGLSGSTALELAVKSTHPEMVKILVTYDRFAYTEDHLVKSFRYMINSIMMSNSVHDIVSNIKHRNTIDIMEIMCYDMQYRMKCNYIKEIAHVFMNSSKFNVNNQDDELNTPLHRATQECLNCSYGYLKTRLRWRLLQIQTIDYVVQLLLKKGANFNMKNTFGETPLIIASEKGCCHIIQILFDWEQKSGMKLDVDARDQFGATALIKAAEKNHVSVMRLLLNHKVSVNLHDYYGFTALHAAIYAPNGTYFDLHFLCKNLRKRKLYCLHDVWSTIGEKVINPLKTSVLLQENLETDKKTTRCKEEMVKLLLALDETSVNFTDFRGNTPLDLAVKSSKRITSETFKALKNRGAIQTLLESKDEAPIQLARIDERGRNPLHRLVISQISNYAAEEIKAVKTELDDKRVGLMVDAILLKPENFRQSATATDGKGRTPLHCASMSSDISIQGRDLARMLLQIGSNVNAADIYGKTPLHYAEMYYQHKLLIEYEAEENKKDKSGHTPGDLRQLRESVTANIDNVQKSLIGKKPLCTYRCIGQLLSTVQVTKLSKQKLVETVRIYSQSPRPKESPEEAIWQVWIQDDFLRLNRRISQLRPSIQRLIERLVDGIKERDPRFECQPILVGSADEETKAVISADFDFNFKLIKFSQLYDAIPHPLGPKGYVQLRRKRGDTERRQSDADFDCFFNIDQCLLTNEVNSRFQIVLVDVLRDPSFWQDEHLFEWNLTDLDEHESEKPAGLCKTVRLRMINPILVGANTFLFANVSIDIVASIHLEHSSLEDQLPVAISPSLKADGCTLVFDRPRFDPSKPRGAHPIFSETFARISFAPLESRVIRESSSVIKAAYIVCKLILYDHPKTTYQLKTCLLFCMEALKGRRECEGRDEDKITPKELAFWVERLMFCFMEFSRHDAYPCYCMPSFRQQVVELECHVFEERSEVRKQGGFFKSVIPFVYSAAFDIYLDLCPDNTVIDIPIIKNEYMNDVQERSLFAAQDPKWEQFDRKVFIGMLSSRTCS